MKAYLIQFTYDHYCQGYENATIIVLVYAVSFINAIGKIQATNDYRNARDFENLTIE